MVAFGLLIVLHISAINIYLMIGLMLIFTSVIRFSPSLNEILGRLLSNNFKIGLVMTGFIHGLTNLGGAPLVAITNGIYKKKISVQSNIAYAYLTMAVVQIVILIVFGDFIVNTTALFLPFCSAIIYLFIGKRVFENTNEILYNNLMTFFIFLYGLLLIHFYFKF